MSRFRAWFSPIVHLSNNWISLIGVVLVTSSTVFWIYLLPTTFGGEMSNPYLGILGFLVLPGVFFTGLALIPLGISLRLRRERKRGTYPTDFPPLNLRNADFLLRFGGVFFFDDSLKLAGAIANDSSQAFRTCGLAENRRLRCRRMTMNSSPSNCPEGACSS